ncbi:MAG: hypothetical protein DRO87_06100 [Candidatus Thorarchaeota archaeon]|nr:MAG: hypothetical protein DRP09_09025 [Candidatus Thorarchaeota archaeon]RLI58151.1 MAG: hypothetical protein DRO87_06100 [Candidatus Thorarchaeota archaeon]
MTHCELWLESADGVKQLRVALLAPEGFEIPEGFMESEIQRESIGTLYVSIWIDGIVSAKKFIDKAAQFYSDRGLKFLYFREIRKPWT